MPNTATFPERECVCLFCGAFFPIPPSHGNCPSCGSRQIRRANEIEAVADACRTELRKCATSLEEAANELRVHGSVGLASVLDKRAKDVRDLLRTLSAAPAAKG